MPHDPSSSSSSASETETEAVKARYARRLPQDPRYSLLNPSALAAWQERQRALCALLVRQSVDPAGTTLLEVGCGAGGTLLELLRLGFAPQHLGGIELLPERLAVARASLPPEVALHGGD